MGINLNDSMYTPPINQIAILKEKVAEVPDELIFFRYLGNNFRVGGVCSSPFRKDKKPSFGVFIGEEGELVFNDLGSKDSGSVFTFLMKYYTEVEGIIAIREMIKKFNIDMKDFNSYCIGKGIDPSERNIKSAKYKKNRPFKLEIKTRPFTFLDGKFWNQFGITEETLNLFNVFPISNYFINQVGFKADRLAYAYIETKDDEHTIKIYQPLNKKMKWIANINFSIHQGYRILPNTGNLLVITKSLKDVMSLYDTAKVVSIAVQGEKARIKDSVIEEYKKRFTNIITLFDNDTEGKNLYEYFKKNYNIDGILIPLVYKCKDYSDLVKEVMPLEAANIIKFSLNEKLKYNGKKN